MVNRGILVGELMNLFLARTDSTRLVEDEQIRHSGINQGYDGLIPEYDSALSLACIMCHAADYHNEAVMMHEPLPKFIPAGFANKDTGTEALTVGPVGTEGTPTTPVALMDFLLASMMRSMLEATKAEFMKLPLFARPMARGGLKKKAGMSGNDIRVMIRSLSEALAETKKAFRTEVTRPGRNYPGV